MASWTALEPYLSLLERTSVISHPWAGRRLYEKRQLCVMATEPVALEAGDLVQGPSFGTAACLPTLVALSPWEER